MRTVGIIIPTNREAEINLFLKKWNFPDYCKLYIIEDNLEKEFELSKEVYFHGSWKDFEGIKNNWIFSKQCGGGIRSFGFWKAYQDGCDYFITLDDDCLPADNCNGKIFVEAHIKQLEVNNGKWLWTTKEIRPRGVPYQNLGNEDETMINMGFWKKNADFDAPTQLLYGSIEVLQQKMNPVPKGYYFPLCGMNMSFKREAILMMFQPLMGETFGVWRFDDIWFGIIAKKICDHLNFLIRAGEPSIIHNRASNVWSNLKKEIPGLEANEEFWEIIDNIKLKGITIEDCYLEIAKVLKKREEDYCKLLGVAMECWIKMF